MKKTLIICNHYPLPETVGTNIRTMNFVRFFRDYGPVDIAYSYTLPGAETGNSVFRSEYFLKREKADSLYERFLRWVVIRNRPLPIPQYERNAGKQLMELIESQRYDYILVRYVHNTWSLFKLKEEQKMKTIIDFDDIISGSLYEANLSTADGSLRKLRLSLNRRYLIAYEKKCLGFGASLFCSEKDRSAIVNGNHNIRAHVVPNIYHNEAFRDYDFGDGYLNRHRLLFVGGLMYRPNIEGLTWFVETVFRELKKKHPEAVLLLVGHSPAPEIIRLSTSVDGIELHADVPDIREYYRQCGLLVVPILSGGGTRIKILEAALANRPVIATPKGAEGLDLLDGRDLLLFHNNEDFLLQYGKLLERNTYQSLIENAKKIVSEKYSQQRFHNDMEQVVSRINGGDRNVPSTKAAGS